MNHNKKILVYDDVCSLCIATKNSISKRDTKRRFDMVGAQSEQGKRLRREYNLDTEKSAYIIDDGMVREKSDMVLYVLGHLGWFERTVARVGRLVPKTIRDALYSTFAKHRNFFK